MRIWDLRQKEVIDISSCASLGYVIDLEFDEKKGQITALVVLGTHSLSNFWSHEQEQIIPWKQILCIGPDIILVEAVSKNPSASRLAQK